MFKRRFWSASEIFTYFAVYIFYIVIGLWKLINIRDNIYYSSKFEFANGWKILKRPRDDTNDELENFSNFITQNWCWYLAHAAVSALITAKWPKKQSYGHAAVSALALFSCLQLESLALFAVLLASFYLATQWQRKSYVWVLAAFWMVIINYIKNSHYWYDNVGYTEYFTLIIILSWSLLRCCSFALTCINNSMEMMDMTNFIGYTMYFPCLVYGPFLSFTRYKKAREKVNIRQRSLEFAWELLRVAFWWLVMQFSLHYVYIHYMARDVSAVELIGSVFWQHAAGYFMGQFFFLYYIVTYGLGIAFARFDGIDPPHRPRCIGRIHFYSDMWKYFDEGLYDFLFRHIYCELCGKRSSAWTKFFATAVTFGFVFVWHGCYTYVLIWSVLNFVCLAAEKCFKWLVAMPAYTQWTLKHFGVSGAQRLRALLATQLFIPAAFSNVYFISGQEVGNYLMKGAYMSGIGNYLILSFCSYCFFQCSEVLLSKTKAF